MIKEAIGVAATIEEAKEKALAELGLTFEDDFQVELLEYPKTKLLGIFGGRPAKVKVYVELPDSKPAKVQKAKSQSAKKAPAEKSELPKEEVKNEKEVDASQIDKDTPAGKGVAYLENILNKLGCKNIKISVCEIENGVRLTIVGDDLGVIIGHRGETLDSLQYLVSLAANSGTSGYYRVVLNIGDFREKREQTLIALAKRMSEQALKSGKCRTLEPMNPYERRVIHTAVQEIEGVYSTSFGEGGNRRVVIAPNGKEARPRTERNSRGNYNRGRGNRNGRNGERKEAYKPEIDPERTPVKDADSLPLYGRIDK